MAGQTNNIIDQFTVSRDGVLKGPENTVASSISVSTTLSFATRTVSVTTSGKTISLPGASESIVGQDWTIHLGVGGYVDIKATGSDTFVLPEADSTIRLDVKGSSVTLRCMTTSTWGIV